MIRQIFASEKEVPHFNAIAWMMPCQYHHKWYIAENYIFSSRLSSFLVYLSAAESIHVSSTTFTQSAQKATEFSEIKQPLGLLRRSRSFKVTDFGTNGKLICNFLLVINTNLAPILHRFRDMALETSKLAIFCCSSLV